MTSADRSFWETLHLLVEWKRTGKDVKDDVEDWVNKVVARCEAITSERVNEEDEFPVSEGNVSGVNTPKVVDKRKEIKNFLKSLNLPPIRCKFSHPHVRSRLEKLMGSNVVCLTDRDYMQKLQQRILQDYAHKMSKRIAVRQADEMERVKNLVLIGKIPISEAPPEMANHPVMLIEMYCNKLIAERRAKIKVQKIYIPNYLYWDDTPDPPSGLCIEKGHIFKSSENKLCLTAERFLPTPKERGEGEEEVEEEEEEELDPYMFSQEEFEKIKYESPLIKELRACETVEEMYALADEIIGVLKTIAEKKEEIIEEEHSPVHSSHEQELPPDQQPAPDQQSAPEQQPTPEQQTATEQQPAHEQEPTPEQQPAPE